MLHNLAQNAQKTHKIFHCEKCDYSTCHSGMWNRHIKTKKHNATEMLHDATKIGTKRTKSTKSTKGRKLWECAFHIIHI